MQDNMTPTKEQQRVIDHRNGPAMVVAGAGSGKTHTVVQHVAALLDDGIPPNTIMMLTFTRKAAEEMRTRTANYVGAEKAAGIIAGTFHGIGARMLRQYGWEPDPENEPDVYVRDFDILGEGEAGDTLQYVRGRLNLTYEHNHGLPEDTLLDMHIPKGSAIASFLSLCTNRHMSIAEGLIRLEKARKWTHPEMETYLTELAEAWRTYKIEKRMLTYDDVLLAWFDMLMRRPHVVSDIQAIVVDEAQDMNDNQFDIIYQMYESSATDHLVLVGDAAQSIYGWRGSDVEQFDQFSDTFPDGTIYELSTSFRSTPEILKVANTVLEGTHIKSTTKLRANRSNGAKVQILKLQDTNAQAKYIADTIAKLPPYETVGVISRTSQNLTRVETYLRTKDIEYAVFGGPAFSERKPVRDIMAMLRFAYDAIDEASVTRLLGLFNGVGDKTASQIVDAGVPNCLIENPFRGKETMTAKNALVATDTLQTIWYRMINVPWPDTMEHAIVAYRWVITKAKETYFERNKKRFSQETMQEKVDEFQKTLETFDNEIAPNLRAMAKMATSARSFADMFKLDRPPAENGWDGRVSLTTVHSAKGLEYDHVIVMNCTDGDFSTHGTAATLEDEIAEQEEQRRCLYVAVTRAKDTLTCTFPEYDEIRHDRASLSRYLKPLSVERIGGTKSRRKPPKKQTWRTKRRR